MTKEYLNAWKEWLLHCSFLRFFVLLQEYISSVAFLKPVITSRRLEVSNFSSVLLIYGLVLRCAFPGEADKYCIAWSFISDAENLLAVWPQMCLQSGNPRTQLNQVSLSILLFYDALGHSELFYSCLYVCVLQKKPKPCGLHKQYVDDIFHSSLFWALA